MKDNKGTPKSGKITVKKKTSDEQIDEINVSAMEEGEIKLRKTKSQGKRLRALVFFAVLAVAALAAVVHFFFIVENVTVEGNLFYDSDVVIERSGIEKGGNMFGFSVKNAEDNIMKKLGGVSSAKISRRLPGEVVIKITEHIPSMYVSIGDTHYILSADMLVLKSTEALTPEESDSLVKVHTPAITGCIAGSKLVTGDGDVAYLIEELYAALCGLDMDEQVSEIDFRDKFGITVKYGDFVIKLGNALKLTEKLDMAKKITDRAETKHGTVDVTDDGVSRGIHTVD